MKGNTGSRKGGGPQLPIPERGRKKKKKGKKKKGPVTEKERKKKGLPSRERKVEYKRGDTFRSPKKGGKKGGQKDWPSRKGPKRTGPVFSSQRGETKTPETEIRRCFGS